MNIIRIDDLRVASMANLYTPPIEESMEAINSGIANLQHMMQTANSALLQDAVSFAQHYSSDEILQQMKDVRSQSNFSFDSTVITYNGDIRQLTDMNKMILLHQPIIYEAVKDDILSGYGYKIQEPLEDTIIYQNITYNQSAPDRDPCLFVDSSECDYSIDDLLHIDDMLNDAIKLAISDGDFMEG